MFHDFIEILILTNKISIRIPYYNKLDHIRKIYESVVYIQSLPEDIQDCYKTCNKLYLDNCKLTKIEALDSLGNLPYVYLCLSRNKITRIENLDNLKNLRELSLAYNKITRIENLDSLISLEYLHLYGNEIREIKNVDKLIKLIQLDLSDNKISKIENLDKLVNLRYLILDSNKITNKDYSQDGLKIVYE
jgi:internalin A